MASDRIVGQMLAFMHELFPTRDISAATLDAWASVFEGWSDAEFERCARAAVGEADRRFFPTPGEIIAYRPKPVELSAIEVRAKITALGHTGPRFEWVLPSVERVREMLGDVVAAAYGHVGPHRLGSDNEMTREIAERDFAEALSRERAASRSPQPDTLRIGAGEGIERLPAGPPAVAGDTEPQSAIERWSASREGVSKRVQPPPS